MLLKYATSKKSDEIRLALAAQRRNKKISLGQAGGREKKCIAKDQGKEDGEKNSIRKSRNKTQSLVLFFPLCNKRLPKSLNRLDCASPGHDWRREEKLCID